MRRILTVIVLYLCGVLVMGCNGEEPVDPIQDEECLTIDMVHLSDEEYKIEQLQTLDKESLLDIIEWMEDVEESIDVEITIIDDEGNIHENLNPLDNKGFFVEWDYSIDQSGSERIVNVELSFELRRTVYLGESVSVSGFLFTFYDDITGGRVDDFYSVLDGATYLEVRATLENITDEPRLPFTFHIRYVNPDGRENIEFDPISDDSLSRTRPLEPGDVSEGFIRLFFVGDGEYIIEIRSWEDDIPFVMEVIVPVYDIEFPERAQRERREVEIPEVVFDLGEITLFDHDLSSDSFFHSVPFVSELGNTYMILEQSEEVRDDVGVVTHDSLRIVYSFFEIDPEFEDDDAVDWMLWWADEVQQGGRPRVIIGNIRASEDRQTAFLHTRRGSEVDQYTRLFVFQMLGDGNELVLFETWLWTLNEETLIGERRSAVEEFDRITGIDFIGILRETFEGQ